MKPTQVHGIYLTKEQHLQGVDWLVKDPEAWDWLYGYWASNEFRVVSEQNRLNRQSRPLVHRYGADGHVCKMLRMVRRNVLGSISITSMFGSLHIKVMQMQRRGW
jgi:hypothetical protein